MFTQWQSKAWIIILPCALVLCLGFAGGHDPAYSADPSLRASFTYVGGTNCSGDWSDVDCWSATGCGTPPCYPRTGSDDAIFNGAFGTIGLDASYTIDDLTIDDGGHTEFNAGGTARTLTCDTLVISGETNDPDSGGGAQVKYLACVETN